MTIETDRSTLIQEGDEEVIRQEQQRGRKKVLSGLRTILDEAVKEALETWIGQQARKAKEETDTTQQTTTAQIEVTKDEHDREPFHLKSTLGIAKTGTTSLRATVPEGIVVFLDLKADDKLEWKMDVVNGERVAVVKKLKGSEP